MLSKNLLSGTFAAGLVSCRTVSSALCSAALLPGSNFQGLYLLVALRLGYALGNLLYIRTHSFGLAGRATHPCVVCLVPDRRYSCLFVL